MRTVKGRSLDGRFNIRNLVVVVVILVVLLLSDKPETVAVVSAGWAVATSRLWVVGRPIMRTQQRHHHLTARR